MRSAQSLPAGTQVRLKPPYAKRWGSFVRVISGDGNLYTLETSGGSAAACRDDFTVVRAPTSPPPFFPMRKTMPYGAYHCGDGSRVLFNRDYEPILRIASDGTRTTCDPAERIDHDHDRQEWFYREGRPPWDHENVAKRCIGILEGR